MSRRSLPNIYSPIMSTTSSMGSTNNEDSSYIPPWTSPYVIGVAGFSGSGKTTVAQTIIQQINEPCTVLLSMDNFYKPLTVEQKKKAFNSEYDFDTPEALDLDLMFRCVRDLKEGKRVEIPVYSFSLHNRTSETITIYGANVIIIEGIYSLYNPALLKLMDCKIYVDTDLDICYARRLLRDIVERGRDLEGIIKQWDDFVKPNSVRFVKPTMNSADVVIPRGSDNKIAIDMIIQHIRKQLQQKSFEHIRQLKKLGRIIRPLDYSKIHVLPQTNQLKGMKTIILNKDTTNDEFVFYFNRMATLLIYASLELVEYVPTPPNGIAVITPTGHKASNPMFQTETVIAVDIIRSGDCFIPSLRKAIPEVALGKLLIQSDLYTGEPQLHTERLPRTLDSPHIRVLLFDAQIISGAAAIMAIKVLMDHGVPESKIVMVTYFCTEVGIRRILNTFPAVNVVIGSLSKIEPTEPGVDSDSEWWMSNRFIDSKYFGTD